MKHEDGIGVASCVCLFYMLLRGDVPKIQYTTECIRYDNGIFGNNLNRVCPQKPGEGRLREVDRF